MHQENTVVQKQTATAVHQTEKPGTATLPPAPLGRKLMHKPPTTQAPAEQQKLNEQQQPQQAQLRDQQQPQQAQQQAQQKQDQQQSQQQQHSPEIVCVDLGEHHTSLLHQVLKCRSQLVKQLRRVPQSTVQVRTTSFLCLITLFCCMKCLKFTVQVRAD